MPHRALRPLSVLVNPTSCVVQSTDQCDWLVELSSTSSIKVYRDVLRGAAQLGCDHLHRYYLNKHVGMKAYALRFVSIMLLWLLPGLDNIYSAGLNFVSIMSLHSTSK